MLRLPKLRLDVLRRAEPDCVDLSLDVAGRIIPVAVRRSKLARRMLLRVEAATGRVVLTIPQRLRLVHAEDFVQAHAGWVAARLAKVPEAIPFTPGALVPVRGTETLLVLLPGRGRTTFHSGADGRAELLVRGEEPFLARRVGDFLRSEARRDLTAAVALYAEKLGVCVGRMTLKDTRSRWGSCSAAGDLAFSWRLIMAPPLVLDYLAAHEVTHRLEMNHSHRYWRLLRGVCPHTEEAESWLKRHGASLHRYGRGPI